MERASSTSPFGRTFFTSLFFLLMVVAGLYTYQKRWEEVATQLPILQELTDTYWAGLSRIGGLSGESIQRFYTLDVSSAFREGSGRSSGGDLSVQTSWDGGEVLRKLEEKGFSKGKLRAAGQFVEYIEQHKDMALYEMHYARVPASIKLAQALLESNAGRSSLARNSNNQFGIKARLSGRAREKVRSKQYRALRDEDFLYTAPAIGVFNFHDDHSYDRFESYRTVGDSFLRHTHLLTRPCKPGNKGCYSWIWEEFPVGSRCDITKAARTFYEASGIAPDEFFNGKTTLPYYAACAAGLKMAGYATSPTYHKKIAYLIDTYELWRFDYDLVRAVQ